MTPPSRPEQRGSSDSEAWSEKYGHQSQMTEQPEQPRTFRTEAGRDLYHDHRNGMVIFPDGMRYRIIEIEAQAAQAAAPEQDEAVRATAPCRHCPVAWLHEQDGYPLSPPPVPAALDEEYVRRWLHGHGLTSHARLWAEEHPARLSHQSEDA